jgi:hypothetical protein
MVGAGGGRDRNEGLWDLACDSPVSSGGGGVVVMVMIMVMVLVMAFCVEG